ncbi:MAG: regulatory protein RecX [Clostridiales bacterium]|nr:regulatory protein RecX [Clostridiales bacterium]
MIITEIKELDKKKKKIFIDGECAFALYNGEIRKYQLKEDKELSSEDYEEILHEILDKRAKKRILYLLSDSAKTEYQLRKKLRNNFYPESSINVAIDYAKSYKYINDLDYARQYIECKKNKLSKRQIESKLKERGIPENILKLVFEGLHINEEEIIQAYLKKKNIDVESITPEEKKKVYGYFIRKGFSYEEIFKVF